MQAINLISGTELSTDLRLILGYALKDYKVNQITSKESFGKLKDSKIIFALEADDSGFDLPVFSLLSELKKFEDYPLSGCTAAVIVHSNSELYTKSLSQHIVFLANRLGCCFIGHSVVEAIKGYENFRTWQKVNKKPLKDLFLENAKRLTDRLVTEEIPKNNKKLLVLHASPRNTSNTLALWNMVHNNLQDLDVKILNVENGTVLDCIGCSFKTCLHYSKQKSCFYGGVMVEEIYPAIEEADTILWVCPNYNDAISANLTAVINRLTSLYRAVSFNEKSIYTIIVSGNSGGDSVAKQLIGALNINKGFRLPPFFSLTTIANDPGSIFEVENINRISQSFAENILINITKTWQ